MFALLFMAVPLHAEVMDKEPSVAENWLIAIATGIVAFAAWRWRWWAGALVSVVFAALVFNMLAELHDPYVGADILNEAGTAYVWHFGGSVVLGVGLHVTAAYYGLARRSALTRRSDSRRLP